jgi:hypothetical protein
MGFSSCKKHQISFGTPTVWVSRWWAGFGEKDHSKSVPGGQILVRFL